MNKIKAVIFDMDGVLIDAKDWHYESLNKALSIFGFEISRYDHLITYDGLPTQKKLEMLTLEQGLPKELHPLINKMKQKYTIEMVVTRCRPTFHHQYAMSNLKHSGYRLAVCSNSIKQTVEMMMQSSNLAQYLDFMLSNEDVTNPKPDPEIYTKAMRKLSLSPSECLIVEDNEKGIRAAKASGAHLLKVDSVMDVNLKNIKASILQIEGASA